MQWYLCRTPSQPPVISNSQTEEKDLSERWLCPISIARGNGSYPVHQLNSLNSKNYLHSVKINTLIELLFQWLQLLRAWNVSAAYTNPQATLYIFTYSLPKGSLPAGWVGLTRSFTAAPRQHACSPWERSHRQPRVAPKLLFTQDGLDYHVN